LVVATCSFQKLKSKLSKHNVASFLLQLSHTTTILSQEIKLDFKLSGISGLANRLIPFVSCNSILLQLVISTFKVFVSAMETQTLEGLQIFVKSTLYFSNKAWELLLATKFQFKLRFSTHHSQRATRTGLPKVKEKLWLPIKFSFLTLLCKVKIPLNGRCPTLLAWKIPVWLTKMFQ
jgi:hypothetical protein